MTRAPAEPPSVSVIVPVRDGEDTIADCLDAILATDYPEDRRQILVVDNGSTDATARPDPVEAGPLPPGAQARRLQRPQSRHRGEHGRDPRLRRCRLRGRAAMADGAGPSLRGPGGRGRRRRPPARPADDGGRAPGHPPPRQLAALRLQLQPGLPDHRQRRLSSRGDRAHRPLRPPHDPRPGRRARPPLPGAKRSPARLRGEGHRPPPKPLDPARLLPPAARLGLRRRAGRSKVRGDGRRPGQAATDPGDRPDRPRPRHRPLGAGPRARAAANGSRTPGTTCSARAPGGPEPRIGLRKGGRIWTAAK